MPDATSVINEATQTGWEAGLLVLLVISVFSFFGFVLKKILDNSQTREERLATRVTGLENEIRTELFSQLRISSETMAKVIMASERMCAAADRMIECLERFDATLRARPCMWMPGDEASTTQAKKRTV